jgi:hypothetical protein
MNRSDDLLMGFLQINNLIGELTQTNESGCGSFIKAAARPRKPGGIQK